MHFNAPHALVPPPAARMRLHGVAMAMLAGLLLAMLSGCNSQLDGLYADTSGATRYEFHDDGTVHISVLGAMVTGTYESNADRVLVTGPQGSVVLVRDGPHLRGPMGLQLTAIPRSAALPLVDAPAPSLTPP